MGSESWVQLDSLLLDNVLQAVVLAATIVRSLLAGRKRRAVEKLNKQLTEMNDRIALRKLSQVRAFRSGGLVHWTCICTLALFLMQRLFHFRTSLCTISKHYHSERSLRFAERHFVWQCQRVGRCG